MTALERLEIASTERPPERTDVRAFLEDALARPRRGPTAVVMPAPPGTAMSLLERLRRGDAFHFHDERRSITALGATRTARPAGAGRFALARTAHDAWRREIASITHERCADVQPVWMLGFAFAPGRAREAWSPLGDGLVTSPRWTHRSEPSGSSLTLVVERDEGSTLALAELDAIWDALSERTPPSIVPRTTVRHVDEERWSHSLADVRARIESGALAKVVVARRSVVVAERDFDPVAVMRRLERSGATVFCARRRGVAFVGATPERLFRKRGGQVLTEAIAGTASLDHDPAGLRLLASTKDVHEHQLVVDGITSALTGLRAELRVGARALRTIGAIAHLATPIEARVAPSVSAFDLLEALHPTPAVGGVPREGALQWIAEHEPDRGWYAGPLGWIDAQGNAEVHVALRSALIVGARAYVYAGCGVVDGSEARSEYAETALKLAPMLAALGAER